MKLSDFLVQSGETQSDFGDRIGVPQGTVGRYVRGDRIPRPKIMAKISEATDGQVSAADFYETSALEAAE